MPTHELFPPSSTFPCLLPPLPHLHPAAFTTVVDGKNQSMSTQELAGGARVHYIFQNIFVKCLDVSDLGRHIQSSYDYTGW